MTPTLLAKHRVDSPLSKAPLPSLASTWSISLLKQLSPPLSNPLLCESQYYGRNEDENDRMEESILSANGLGALESSARDAVRTIMEQTGIEDIESLQGALRQGALKVRFFFLGPPLSLFVVRPETYSTRPLVVGYVGSICIRKHQGVIHEFTKKEIVNTTTSLNPKKVITNRSFLIMDIVFPSRSLPRYPSCLHFSSFNTFSLFFWYYLLHLPLGHGFERPVFKKKDSAWVVCCSFECVRVPLLRVLL